MSNYEFVSMAYREVAGWMDAFEVPIDYQLQLDLIEEESTELLEAIKEMLNDVNLDTVAHYLKESGDLIFVLTGYHVMQVRGIDVSIPVPREREARVIQSAKLAAAVLTAVEYDLFGRPLIALREEAFLRVVTSNMSKLVDGKPLRNDAGKVLKGPNYLLPDLEDLAEKALEMHNEDAL